MIATTALVWSTVALAALVVGTDRGETLVGTASADTIRARDEYIKVVRWQLQ
jgi:hypothetical protein